MPKATPGKASRSGCASEPRAQQCSCEHHLLPAREAPLIDKDPITVAANSRYTVYVNSDAGGNLSLCAKVASDQPVIVERPMYFNFDGIWTDGSDVVGCITSPNVKRGRLTAIPSICIGSGDGAFARANKPVLELSH